MRKFLIGVVAVAVLALGAPAAHADYDYGTKSCEAWQYAVAKGRGAGAMAIRAPGSTIWWNAPYNVSMRTEFRTAQRQGSWAVDGSNLDYLATYAYCAG